MKKTQVLKMLRQARAEIAISSYNFGGFAHASITLSIPSDVHGCSPDTYSIKGQADREDSKRAATNTHWSIPGIRRFYGFSYASLIHFDLSWGERARQEFIQAVFDMAREKIQSLNLAYKYPECVLSQLVASLEAMGVKIESPTIDGKSLGDYWIDYRQKHAENAALPA